MSEREVRPNGWCRGLEEANTRRGSSLALVACLMLAALLLSGSGPTWPEGGREKAALCSRCDLPSRDCTIFAVSQGDRVFLGGNSDWINFDSCYYWVDPGSDTRYGASTSANPAMSSRALTKRAWPTTPMGCPWRP